MGEVFKSNSGKLEVLSLKGGPYWRDFTVYVRLLMRFDQSASTDGHIVNLKVGSGEQY